MKYLIHNKSVLQTDGFIRSFEEELQYKLPKLERVLKGYSRPSTLDVYLQKEAGKNYSIIASVRLVDKDLLVHDEADNPVAAINNLMDKLVLLVKKEFSKIRKEHQYKRKRNTQKIGEKIAELETHHKNKDKEQFDRVMVQIIPTLKEYILTYLKENGIRKKTSFTIQEIMDEVYLELYNRLPQRPREEQQFISWIYSETKEFLDKNILAVCTPAVDSSGEYLDLEKMATRELASLEETLTANAEGQPILIDELEDISYLSDLSENNIDENLIAPPELPEINRQARKALQKTAPKERLMFEMFWVQSLSEDEIAHIFNMDVAGTEQILRRTAGAILQTLKTRVL